MSLSGYTVKNITDIYIDECPILSEQKNIEQNLLNVSWVSQIEEELGDSFIDEPLTSGNTTPCNGLSEELESLNIKNIVSLGFNDVSDEFLLCNMTLIAYSIKKQLKQHIDSRYKEEFSILELIEKLEWAYDLTKYFSNKLKLPKINHNYNKNSSIPRSSYKFCDFGKDCEYNYNHKKYSGCYAQHFVYNFISADLFALIDYIKSFKDYTKIKYNEVLTCINTIYYVINHMKDEYLGILSYYPNNSEEMHKERKSSKKNVTRKFKTKFDNNKNH